MFRAIITVHRTPPSSSRSRQCQRSSSTSDVDDDADEDDDNDAEADGTTDTVSELPSRMLSRLRWIHARSRISSSTVSYSAKRHRCKTSFLRFYSFFS